MAKRKKTTPKTEGPPLIASEQSAEELVRSVLQSESVTPVDDLVQRSVSNDPAVGFPAEIELCRQSAERLKKSRDSAPLTPRKRRKLL